MPDRVMSDEVTILMEERVNSLDVLSPNCCINKIPAFIKKGREEFYQPSVVSIGPIYYNESSLKTMQEQKWTYLKYFLDHPWNAKNSLKNYTNFVRKKETAIRQCYEENKHFSSEEFIQMIVLDAAFIIYMFIENSDFALDNMPAVEKKQGLTPYVLKDLLLLENQIPFFVLQGFFALAFGHQVKKPEYAFIKTAVQNISVNFLGSKAIVNTIVQAEMFCSDPKTIKHLLDLLRMCCCAKSKLPRSQKSSLVCHPLTAKKLCENGLKFEAITDSKNSPLHITYSKGKLMIPELVLDTDTEPYLRNLLYFEQCHYSESSYINDYMLFFDKLIDTVEDVQVLQEAGVLKNHLGSDEDAIKFFNNAGNTVGNQFFYSEVSNKANAYASSYWNKAIALFWRRYFSHPWAIISVFAAIILFILTLLQTIAAYNE